MTWPKYQTAPIPGYYIADTREPVEVGQVFVDHRNGRGIIGEILGVRARSKMKRIKVLLPEPLPKRQKHPVGGRKAREP